MRPKTLVLALVLLAPPLAPAQETPEPSLHEELAAFEGVLDVAVGQVSRAGAQHLLAGQRASRSFYLEGMGAVFVLPSRALPGPQPRPVVSVVTGGRTPDALSTLEQSLARVEDGPLRQSLEQSLAEARRSQSQAVPPPPAAPAPPAPPQAPVRAARQEQRRRLEQQRERQLEELMAQTRAFQRDAERMHRQVEQQFQRLSRELRTEALPAAGSGGPSAPLSPTPWSFWFEVREQTFEEPRPAAEVIDDVQAALVAAVTRHAVGLTRVPSEESVVVAVDFEAQAWLAPERPKRSLVLRVKKADLEAHQSGRLDIAQLRQRVETVVY